MTAWFLDLKIYTFKIILQLKAVAHFGMFSRKMFFHVSVFFSWKQPVSRSETWLPKFYFRRDLDPAQNSNELLSIYLINWNYFVNIFFLDLDLWNFWGTEHWLTATGKIQNFLEKLSKNQFESSTHQKIISIKCDLNKKQTSKLTK
jgi:hypothetical protein